MRGVPPLIAMLTSLLLLALVAPVAPVVGADTDKDGLWDGFERRYGFDPARRDSDGDGVVDSAEDDDRDGLGNLGEQRFRTHPRKRDSDGDGRSDSREDHDHDGRSNGLEQDQRRVPAGLRPSIGSAVRNFPPIRFDCQTPHRRAVPVVCAFGPLGATKVVLFGDSHAMMWSQPIKRIANRKGWRFLNMTKTACPSLLGLYTKRQMEIDGGRTCQQWRRKVIKRLRAYPPDLVIITNSDGYKLYAKSGQVQPGSSKKALWRRALKRTLEALPRSSDVLVLGDVPHNDQNPRRCLNHNRHDMSRCVSKRVPLSRRPIDVGLQATARDNGATFRTLNGKICSYDPCPVVQGSILMWRDQGHLTNKFAVTLQPAMRAVLEAALR